MYTKEEQQEQNLTQTRKHTLWHGLGLQKHGNESAEDCFLNCFYDRKLFLRHIRKKKYNTITGHSHRRHRHENTHFGTDKVHTSRSHRESHRTVWTNMDSHGIVWIRVGSFGVAWIRLNSNGFQLIRMESCGFVWIRMDSYGF